MQRSIVGAGLAFVVGAAVIAVSQLPIHGAGASALSQKEIETKAVAQAQKGLGYSQLQGAPTSVTSKQTTLGDFNTRFDPFSHDPRSPNTSVWLVILNGHINFSEPHAPGSVGQSGQANSMFVLLGTDGKPLAWGGVPRGFDLNNPATPITSWLTPTSPK